MSDYAVARRFVMATLDRFLQSRGGDVHDAMIAELEAWQQHETGSQSTQPGSWDSSYGVEPLPSRMGAPTWDPTD